MHRDKLSWLAWLGLAVLCFVFFVALFAPWLAPYDLDYVDVTRQLQAPSARHWLGTDENGADVLTKVIYGTRVAVMVGLATVSICSTVGIFLGSISGYFGGWIDEVIMRITEILMAFPGILLAILLIFITQKPSLLAVIGALSVSGWAGYARLVRGQVLSERERAYVEASRALGFPTRRTLFREIVPNILAPVIVQATFGVAGAILAEAALSFLGLGPQDLPSWGALLDQGATYFLLTPHLAIFPGVAIMITVLSINFLGDGLRDILDPRAVTRAK
ncbi:ABC transporter permease [Persicimonas caeni]|uniref:ABC transporter permease n=2 Tax=Persicimonas caeni TaxID=2292766 RepID=A0A4Y6Q308_PERCE|nr:ABC transporter permease [Persicimonas caeni]QED36052.1 ABC transporter permease [Persicimonas caeni]